MSCTEERVAAYLRLGSAEAAAAELGVSRCTILNAARAAGVSRPRGSPRRYRYDEAFFDSYTPAASYWAGFLAADGTLLLRGTARCIKLGLAAVDRAHVEAFLRCAGSDHPAVERSDGGYLGVAANISSRRWWDALGARFGVGPRKSLTLGPPPAEMPDDAAWHYARGYFDGDGTVRPDGTQLGVVGTQALLAWLRDLWGSHHALSPHASIWRLCVSGPVLRALVPRLYAGSTPDTRLARKYVRLARWLG